MPATPESDLSSLDECYDVVVIGGGPAGATASTLIADAGYRTLMVERETYPRFKIGESLIPATVDTLRRLGMVDRLQASHFTKKHSVQFFTGDGRASAPFYFSETENEQHSQTWQVVRSEFDVMMFDNAIEHGVDGVQGIGVREVLFTDEDNSGRATGVRLRDADGNSRDVPCRVVVDASGQRAVLSRQLGLRTTDPNLRQATIFTHFAGAQRDEGIDEGATLILQTSTKDSWFWSIPLPGDRTSIGVVGSIDYLIRGRDGTPQEIFDQELARCPGLLPRLEGAEQLFDVKVLNEFSYLTERPAGNGWVLCGDAFGFLDPMYSTGVLLALRSAEMAADSVIDALAADDTSSERLSTFAPRLLSGMAAFRKLVYAFYNKDFSFGRFLRQFPAHRGAIVAILVGDVFDRDFGPLYRDLSTMITLPDDAGPDGRGAEAVYVKVA